MTKNKEANEVTCEIQDIEDLIIIDDIVAENNNERWKVNQWYQVPFDCLVCVSTEGQTIYATAELKAFIYFNGTKTQRGAIYSSASYVKGLGGEYWRKGIDSFKFPILTGEKFMVHKGVWSPKPNWMDVEIQVIPYPRPKNNTK